MPIGVGGFNRNAPSPSARKHMENVSTAAASKNCGILNVSFASLPAGFELASRGSAHDGTPSPKMPSKFWDIASSRFTMSINPLSMMALTFPTDTTSVATTAMMSPLPNVIFTKEAFASGPTKVEDLFVPTKHFSDSTHSSVISRHKHDCTITLLLPVSATTSNFCGGVPTSISTV
eukprot:CAMPEP_0169345652 /NCGR_PEP_ID=MMETSP1017-20121227/21688_1 /TAXON_ID=342587 /ORGANISM="Karlodinium micrum, Strain CCMP2283" /LENGTH=175 /DNA_ID=CAMNT_0009441517 /DNA_START=690 /DNA_END=1217 /DNA_ORIENTATION=-